MGRTAWWTVCVGAWLAAEGCEHYCPDGYYKQDGRCYRVRDAGSEGGADGGSEDNGERDDGGGVGTASEGGTALDPDAGLSVDRPEIEGAASMAPGRELWTWSAPAGTQYFELLVDEVAPESGARQTEPRFSQRLELGEHTLKVRACHADETCSGWAVHTTRVESFGSDLPRGLRDAAREFPNTALGHRVAIGCNDCADGPNSEVYDLEQAAASIERALDRGADLIELNVASIGGKLYISPTDSLSAASRPQLADILRRDSVAQADALIVVEVVENSELQDPAAQDAELPEAFAQRLLSAIAEVPSVARNGRPLWVRASYANRSYLQALAEESARHAIAGPYVRFVVSDSGRDPQSFYGAAGDALVPSLEFLDAVSVDFRLSNLAFRLERVRAAGVAAIVENVPGPRHGEIVLGALRELADAIITDYRVDQARRIVTLPDTGAFFSAKDISADARVLSMHGVRGGERKSWELELGRGFEDLWTSTTGASFPLAKTDASGERFFGRFLAFDEQGPKALPTANAGLAREPSPGFLMSFMGTLPEALQSTVGREIMFGCWPTRQQDFTTKPAWNAVVGGGFQLLGANLATPVAGQDALTPRAALEVSAEGGGAGCSSANQPFFGPLRPGEVRWLVLMYDGTRLTLFIDGRCAAEGSVSGVQEQDDVAASTVVGSGTLGDWYLGAVQQFGVLRWQSTSADATN